MELLQREIAVFINILRPGPVCQVNIRLYIPKRCVIFNLSFRFVAILIGHLERSINQEEMQTLGICKSPEQYSSSCCVTPDQPCALEAFSLFPK